MTHSPDSSSAARRRDFEREASRISALTSLLLCLGAAAFLVNYPNVVAAGHSLQQPEVIAIELSEPMPESDGEPEIEAEPEPIMDPEPIVEAEAEPEPVVEPEPVMDPEPVVEAEPEPAPKPKPKPNPKKTAATEKRPETAPAASGSTKASAPQRAQASFAGEFARMVNKCKFYPKAARQAGHAGTVKVRVTFDSRGNITGYSLIPGGYHPSLGEAALTTMAKVKSRWSPRDGGPSSLVAPINFILR